MIEHRAYSVLNVKGMEQKPDGLTISGIASTPVTDRQGDIVEPMGAKFKTPMPLLWQHHADKPVGLVNFAKPTKEGIPFTAHLPHVKEPGLLQDRVNEAIHSIQYRLVGAVSIGFKAIKGAVESIKGGSHFKEWEWLELSLVTIPANQEATIHTIKSLDQQQRAASGASVTVRSGSESRNANWDSSSVRTYEISPGATGKTLSTFSHKGTGMQTSIGEQIAIHEAEAQFKVKQMDDLLGDGNVLNDDEDKQYKDLAEEVKNRGRQIENLRLREKLLLTATPVSGDPEKASQERQEAGRPSNVIFSKSNKPKGTGFTRLCMAVMAGKGSESDTEKYIQRYFRDTPEVMLSYKAAIAAGTTTDANWAAPLVNYTDLVNEFIDLLRPATILGRMTQLNRIPFNVRIGKVATGVTGGWVGQGLAKPASAMDLDTVTFAFFKMACIVVLTQELVRFSQPQAEAVVRRELIKAIAQLEDVSFIDPSIAGTANVQPASITNGLTPIGNPGTTVATIKAALTTAISNAAAADLDLTTGVWVMHSRSAVYLSTVSTTQDILGFPGMGLTGGTLLGFPVIASNNVPADTGASRFIAFIVQDDIFLADDGTTRIDASDQASIQMDSAPSAGAQSLVSLWQNNMVGLRAERFANWARRHNAAVQLIEDVSF